MYRRTKLRRFNMVIVPRRGRSFYNVVVSYHFLYVFAAFLLLFVGGGVFLVSRYMSTGDRAILSIGAENGDQAVVSLLNDAEQIRRDLDELKEVSRQIQDKTGISSEPGYIDYIRDRAGLFVEKGT